MVIEKVRGTGNSHHLTLKGVFGQVEGGVRERAEDSSTMVQGSRKNLSLYS